MSDVSQGTGLREHLHMASRFLRNPRTIGAVSPSSAAMARMMVEQIPADRHVNVVELGPGTGSFTNAIAKRVARGSRVLAIDLEPSFIERVRRRWPSVEAVCGSAVDLETLLKDRRIAQVDHYISGLPFATLRKDEITRILDGIQRSLKPGGTFTTFQYLHGYALPWGRFFRRDMTRRMGGPPQRTLVLKNFPPSFIFNWTKRA